MSLSLTLGLLLSSPVLAVDRDPSAADSYIKVEIRGRLRTGLVAIGGETTGTQVRTSDGTVELDFQGNKDLLDRARQLNGKDVVVTGSLTVKPGVEIRQRLIVKVVTLRSANAPEK